MREWFLDSQNTKSSSLGDGEEEWADAEEEELTNMERQLLGIAVVDGEQMDLETMGPH